MSQPKFAVEVTLLSDRIEKINSKIGPTTERQVFRYFSTPLILPVIRIPLDGLVYRMKNGRTRIQQAKYIRDNSLLPTYFSAGQENISAQRAQHAILLDFARSDRGRVLQDVLEKDKEQTDPLLITREGVVLNGNRRLALMREFLAEDKESNKTEYSAFENVVCQVLDQGIGEPEMREIEIRLQGARETKLEYDWIDEILLAEDLERDGKSRAQIADFMNLKKPDLDDLFDRLNEAKFYVTNYLKDDEGRPGTLDLLRDSPGAEQQFIELTKALKKMPDNLKRQARAVHHVLTANPADRGKGRKYDVRGAYQQDNLAKVLERIADLEKLPTAEPAERDGGIDIFTPDEPETGGADHATVVDWLEDRSDSNRKADIIRDIARGIIDDRKSEDQENQALNDIKDALETVRSITLREASRKTLPEIERALVELKKAAEAIEAEIERLRARM